MLRHLGEFKSRKQNGDRAKVHGLGRDERVDQSRCVGKPRKKRTKPGAAKATTNQSAESLAVFRAAACAPAAFQPRTTYVAAMTAKLVAMAPKTTVRVLTTFSTPRELENYAIQVLHQRNEKYAFVARALTR